MCGFNNANQQMSAPERDYNSISPSAQSLLLLKGLTNIPFAKEAAALMLHPEKYEPDLSNKDPFFFARLLHFENRYWSIDQLLAGLPGKNILELSSGFSFRGLQMVKEKTIHYIDTDLPDLIEIKKKFIESLQAQAGVLAGTLETLPLNVLDEKQFDDVLSHFPKAEITIVNEGLLMYLGMQEKEKLCSIIHRVLQQRGGYWITADIYIKRKISEQLDFKIDERERKFFEKHQIEENKFASFEEAKAFFTTAGFIIDKIAEPDHSKLSSLKYIRENMSPGQFAGRKRPGKYQETWRLKVV
jgi:hypothetical protein